MAERPPPQPALFGTLPKVPKELYGQLPTADCGDWMVFTGSTLALNQICRPDPSVRPGLISTERSGLCKVFEVQPSPRSLCTLDPAAKSSMQLRATYLSTALLWMPMEMS